MNRNARLVLVAVVAVIAVFTALGAVLSRGQKSQEASSATGAAPAAQTAPMASEVLERSHSPVIGAADAPVTIVEFFDPACEGCRAFHPHVKLLLAEDPARARLVLRYVPLHGEVSVEAVGILEAARAQSLFEPVLDALMEQQPQWASHHRPAPEQAWVAARQAGLDVEAARRYLAANDVGALMELEIADAMAVKLDGTPMFFVNGQALTDLHPATLRQRVIEAAGVAAH